MAGNFLTDDPIAGIPNWAVFAGLGLAVVVWRRHQSQNQSTGAQQAAQQAAAAQLAQEEQLLAAYPQNGSQAPTVTYIGGDGSGTPPATSPTQPPSPPATTPAPTWPALPGGTPIKVGLQPISGGALNLGNLAGTGTGGIEPL